MFVPKLCYKFTVINSLSIFFSIAYFFAPYPLKQSTIHMTLTASLSPLITTYNISKVICVFDIRRKTSIVKKNVKGESELTEH